jgi:16S rRNA (cytidine1402-2'-O)-methyltransferase
LLNLVPPVVTDGYVAVTPRLNPPLVEILFESPHRVAKLLRDAAEVLGDREACVCVDLTKRFEATHRGSLSALAEQFDEAPGRGEITIVIAGNTRR